VHLAPARFFVVSSRQPEWFLSMPIVHPFFTFNQRKPILRKMKLAVILAIVLIPAVLHAAFEVESILKAGHRRAHPGCDHQPGRRYGLCPHAGAVLIYSTDDQAVLDRIPGEKPFDRIAYQDTMTGWS
jgi:hypothetical protein